MKDVKNEGASSSNMGRFESIDAKFDVTNPPAPATSMSTSTSVPSSGPASVPVPVAASSILKLKHDEMISKLATIESDRQTSIQQRKQQRNQAGFDQVRNQNYGLQLHLNEFTKQFEAERHACNTALTQTPTIAASSSIPSNSSSDDSSSNLLSSHFTTISTQLLSLTNLINEAAFYLPGAELRAGKNVIKQLELELEKQKEKYVKRKKFQFRNKKRGGNKVEGGEGGAGVGGVGGEGGKGVNENNSSGAPSSSPFTAPSSSSSSTASALAALSKSQSTGFTNRYVADIISSNQLSIHNTSSQRTNRVGSSCISYSIFNHSHSYSFCCSFSLFVAFYLLSQIQLHSLSKLLLHFQS